MIRYDAASTALREETTVIGSESLPITAGCRPIRETLQVWVNGDALPASNFSLLNDNGILFYMELAEGDTVRLLYQTVL